MLLVIWRLGLLNQVRVQMNQETSLNPVEYRFKQRACFLGSCRNHSYQRR